MSGTQVSSGTDPNILLRTLSGQQTADVNAQQLANQQNQLMMPYRVQQAQQQVGGNEMEMMGRAAQGLLGMSEADAAAAYPGVVANLQANGFAKNAPSVYPGHAAIQNFVGQAIPVADQYKLGIALPPGLTSLLTGNQPPAAGGGGGGGGGALTGSTYEGAIGSHEGLGPDPRSNAVGGFIPSTWSSFVAANPDLFKGMTPEQTMAARSDPTLNAQGISWLANQNAGDLVKAGVAPTGQSLGIAHYLGAGGAAKVMAAPDSDPVSKYVSDAAVKANPELGTMTVGQMKQRYAGVPSPSFVRQPGSPATPSPYQVASNAPVPPPGSTAPPAATPALGPNVSPDVRTASAPTDLVGPRPMPAASTASNLRGGSPVVTPASLANTPTPAPTIPQAPQNALAPPPAPAPAQPPQPAPPPAQSGSQSNLPHASEVPTGVNAPQYKQAQAIYQQIAQLTPYSEYPQVKAKIAQLQQQAALAMQTDSVVQTQEGQVHTLTGAIEKTAAPLPHYVYNPDAGGPGIPGYTDTTGTNKPEINPARRMNVRPDGSVINDQGQVIAPAMPGATPPLGSFEVQKADYNRDAEELPKIAAAGQQAQTAQVRLQTMLDLLPKITTGAGGYTRTQLANLAETAGFPSISQALIANSSAGDAGAAQEFGKLTLAAAGAAERGDLGSRGSLGALKLYQQNNPGLDLRPGANKAMIGMQLIAAQADTDYSQAALAYANQHQNDFRTGKAPYQPLANFDLNWQQQRNPQVYAAAMGALNGQPVETWSKGLNDAEYKRALDVVSRASPSAVVNGKSGRISMQPNASGAAAPVTVQTPAEAQALPPGTPYMTPDGRKFTR